MRTTNLGNTLDRMLTLNRALDQAFLSAWSGSDGARRVWVPALDVAERNDAYLVSLELPGVDPSGVEVSFEQNVLTVRGTKPSSFEAQSQAELRVYAAERVAGAFERSVRLPEFVDGENIAAEYANGVLNITVPKARTAQPRRIEVRQVSTPARVEG